MELIHNPDSIYLRANKPDRVNYVIPDVYASKSNDLEYNIKKHNGNKIPVTYKGIFHL